MGCVLLFIFICTLFVCAARIHTADTLTPCIFVLSGKPKVVRFRKTHSNSIELTWDGHDNYSTYIQYVFRITNENIIHRYERILPPGVTSTTWTEHVQEFNDIRLQYRFALYYIPGTINNGKHWINFITCK